MIRDLLAVAALSCASVGPVTAQGRALTFGRGGGVGGTYSSDRQTQEDGRSTAGNVRQLWVRFPARGFLISPYLFTFEVEAQPTFIRQESGGIPGTQSSDILNIVYSLSMLQGQLLSLDVNGAKSSNATSGGPGGRRELDRSLIGTRLRFQFRPLPIGIAFQRSVSDELWTPELASATPFRSRGEFSSIRATASNSKLTIEGYRNEYDDQVRDQDYVIQGFQTFHRFRWGRGSSLESSLGQATQEGSFANQRSEWTERLQLHHHESVRTDYTLSRTSYKTPEGESVNRSFTGGAAVTATRHLGLGMVVSGSRSKTGTSKDNSFYAAPRVGLELGDNTTGRFEAKAVAGLEHRSITGAGGETQIFDESHEVPSARLFTLDRPDIVSGTVVARTPDGTVTYIEGQDFDVVLAGRVTQLRIPLGSRILVGDLLTISYRHRGRETGVGSAVRAEVSASFEWRGFSVRHDRSVRQAPTVDRADSTAGDTPSSLFEGHNESRTRLGYQGIVPMGDLALSTGMRSRTIGDLHATEYDLNGTLTPPRLGSILGSVAVGWTSTTADDRTQEALTLSGNATMPLGSRVRLGGTVEQSNVKPSDGPGQRWLIGRADISIRMERVVLELQGELFQEQEPLPRSRSRLNFRFTRTF